MSIYGLVMSSNMEVRYSGGDYTCDDVKEYRQLQIQVFSRLDPVDCRHYYYYAEIVLYLQTDLDDVTFL